MTRDDVDAIVQIERLAQPDPWPIQIFVDELQREWARVDVIRVAGDSGEIVAGYCNYWIVRDEIHLLNIAIHPDFRRCGLASRLLDALFAVAAERDSRFVTLEVRASNAGAIALYQRFGFSEAGVRKKYYANNNEDAIVMTLDIVD